MGISGKKVTAGVFVLSAVVLLLMRGGKEHFVLSAIRETGYDAEIHHTITEDGYILGLHRILNRNENNKTVLNAGKYPILFVHGLESSAADWVYFHGKNSLPYLLLEIGFDVWLGNIRGTQESFNHTSVDPYENPKKFWNTSVHEIGYYDIPAMVDYVLEKTNKEKLFYVGISQGEATFLIMTSTRPEYNKKIQLASLTSPSSHLKHSDNVVLKFFGAVWPYMQIAAESIGLYTCPGRDVIGTFCQYQVFGRICSFLYNPFLGYTNLDQTVAEYNSRLFQVYPVKSAFKQFVHYAQMYNSGIFRRFDYGKQGNLRQYGSEEPPEYDLNKITAPVAYFWGINDCWSRPKDVEDIEKKLPNLVLSYRIPNKFFNHYDLLVAKDAKTLAYQKIMDTIFAFNETR